MATLLFGAPVAEAIKREIPDFHGLASPPRLDVLAFNSGLDDLSYQRTITKLCGAYGIEVSITELAGEHDPQAVQTLFDEKNRDPMIDGLLFMGKFPSPELEETIKRTIDRRKDVEGIGYENTGKLIRGDSNAVLPCTVEAVLRLLEHYQIPLREKNVCVLGRSYIVGRPLAMCLADRAATVTICHSHTIHVERFAKKADLLVSAIGRANYVNRDFVKENAVVIDVGINFDKEGKLCGDVDAASLEGLAQAVTPVPKGVGVITNAVLLSHIYQSYQKRENP